VPADLSSEHASFQAVSAEHELPWIENRAGGGWLPHLAVRELWAFQELAIALALKTLRVRYKQTFFGVAWAVLQPILAVVVFTIVFGRLAGLPADGLPYPVFNYSAMILWLYVSASVLAAANSLVDNRELVQKVYFPRLIAPLSAAVPGLVDFAIAFGVLVVLILAYGVSTGPQVLLTPFWVAAAVAVVLSVGVPFSALNVKFRDVRQVLPLLVQIWLFASPVVYSSSLVPGAWQYVYALNPMVTVLDGFRWSVAGGPPPGPEALVSLAVVVVSLTLGLAYFAREERSFSDVV
jgi:lipopolysaccharide transport system permease protein